MPPFLLRSLAALAFAVHLAQQQTAPPELPAPIRIEREGSARGGELGAVAALEAALPELRGTPDEALALDLLATRLTFVGDDVGAMARDGESYAHARRYAGAGPGALAGHQRRAAAAWIVERARGRRVVMLNEEHRSSHQRAFAHTVLGGLRTAGFTHLALETITTDEAELAALNARKAPLESDGFYTRDPLLGDLVRRALELGMQVAGYEADHARQPAALAADPLAATNWREEQQARALAALLEDDAEARVVVWCGRHHLSEEPPSAEPGEWTPMGGLFAELSGIDPLTVDLMVMTELADRELEPEVYGAVAAELEHPTVFVDAEGEPFSCIDAIDAMVFFPRTRRAEGRPTWAALDGLRAPRELDWGEHAPAPGRPLLLEARVVGEPEAAVPLDRALWRQGAAPALFVRPGLELVARLVDPGARFWPSSRCGSGRAPG